MASQTHSALSERLLEAGAGLVHVCARVVGGAVVHQTQLLHLNAAGGPLPTLPVLRPFPGLLAVVLQHLGSLYAAARIQRPCDSPYKLQQRKPACELVEDLSLRPLQTLSVTRGRVGGADGPAFTEPLTSTVLLVSPRLTSPCFNVAQSAFRAANCC